MMKNGPELLVIETQKTKPNNECRGSHGNGS